MTDFESAFLQIKSLAETFKQNETKFLSTSYQEADVRNDFINKFFIALGWDVRHEHQLNPYEQEVKVEKPVLIASQQKRADYAFFIDPNYRDVKFFAEAKKPSRNLFNKDDYFQTCRYGWNAGTPIAVLTDFEEFHILDCRFKPDINNIIDNKIERFHYSDYLDKEKLSKIYYLFSREAVANNSLEKFADSLPKPRGKSGKKGLFKGGYQSIDESFLEELDEIRLSLAKAFKNNNQELNSDELTEMTQRTIDRLVFIRFLEDKIIEPDDYIGKFAVSKKPWEDFISASRTFDAKYNGIVFKKHKIDTNTFLEPDEKIFSSICNNLAHKNAPYNFDQIPIHILGSIYERFLGKVVTATDKRVKIDDKPEVRKAGGVYYTPQYIVNYIVDNTVGKLIEGKEPKEIANMRFADISCGSGSFLITVFDRLLDYHKKWYQKNPKQAKKDGCHLDDGKWVLSLKQKQKILTQNIYGVDIDHQAVEVTQLSLYLKLLEDETTATANDTWVMFKEKLLPSLNKNIICGNSLIGTDIFEEDLFTPLSLLRRGAGGEVDELKLKPMNFEDAFPDIMKNGGFDAIVGNPPYVNLVSLDEFERKYFQKNYKTCKNKSDLYSFFLEKAVLLSKKDSFKFGYIVPHTWTATESFEPLRKILIDNDYIESITVLGFNVFKKVIVSTLIVICSPGNHSIRVLNNKFNEKFKISTKTLLANNYHIDLDWNQNRQALLDKLKLKTIPLENIIQFSRGIKTSNDKRFISTIQKNSDYKRIFRGRNIKAYQLNWNGEYIWYRPDLMKQKVGCLPHSKEFFEAPQKLITQRVNSSMQLLVAYDNEKNYFLDTTNVSRYDSWDKKHSFKYICAVLNSKLINYWYCNNYKMPTIGLYELHSIPFKQVDFKINLEKSLHDKLVHLVDQMLESKKKLQEVKTESEKNYLENKCNTIDRQIDTIVYELYGLTEDEIKIVEGN